MKAHFEKISLGSQALLCFQREDPSFPFHWHYHPEFELTLIQQGHGQRLVGDGIADYTNFGRQFRCLKGCSPAQLRRHFHPRAIN